MIEILKNSVDILKKRTRYNLDLLHQNENSIKETLKEPVSEKRSEKLNQQFFLSKKILAENNEMVKLQKDIKNYLEIYHNDIIEFSQGIDLDNKSTELGNEIFEISKEDYFDLTIKGEIIFDTHHPYYNDETFFKGLLAHFISIENYEMCSLLVELDKSKNLSEKQEPGSFSKNLS